MTVIPDLETKSFNAEFVAKQALQNEELINILLDSVLSKIDLVRFNAHTCLVIISKENPEVLYARWDFFEKLLTSKNNYHIFIGINILANLVRIDNENRFETLFESFMNIINSDRTMVAGTVAGVAGKLALTCPYFEEKITSILLNIESTYHGKQLELIKAYIVESFDQYYEQSSQKDHIMTFVQQQLDSSSPKSRKAAKAFLKKRRE